MSKKNSKLPLVLGFALFEAYRFYNGKGAFNKIRFKSQHAAISAYLEKHYPNAFYSDITATEDGWSCIINNGGKRSVLYMTKAPDGNFIFWENDI